MSWSSTTFASYHGVGSPAAPARRASHEAAIVGPVSVIP